MDIIKYESLLKIVQYGSLTKAGEALGYTQSGMSHLLNSLEDELGVTLLIRDRSGIKLTSEGQRLIPYFQTICSQQHEMDLLLTEILGGKGGLIRLATHTSIAGQWLPHIFQEFKKDYPKVSFELHEVATSVEVNILVKNRIVDCGIFTTSLYEKDYIPLYTDQLVAVLSPDHELSSAPYFPNDALDLYPYVALDESVSDSDTYTEIVKNVFASCRKIPKVSLHVTNEYTALAMVAANQGFCILPQMTKDRTRRDLIYLPLENPVYRYTCLAVSEGREDVRILHNFIDTVQTWVENNY
jgi:Transcriptional regulator